MRAIYPGTFDPVTLGHLDVALRASKLFDELIVAVYDAPPKQLLFDTAERIRLWQECLPPKSNVLVTPYSGLTIDLAHQLNASVLVRGLRAISDFEYEFEMALTNKRLAQDVEAIFLMTSHDHLFLSSTRIKELWGLGHSVAGMVPPNVDQALRAKAPQAKPSQTHS